MLVLVWLRRLRSQLGLGINLNAVDQISHIHIRPLAQCGEDQVHLFNGQGEVDHYATSAEAVYVAVLILYVAAAAVVTVITNLSSVIADATPPLALE